MTNLTREVLDELPGWAEEAVLMGEAPVTVPGHHFGEGDVPDTQIPHGLEESGEDGGLEGVPQDGGYETYTVNNNLTTNQTGNSKNTIHPNSRNTFVGYGDDIVEVEFDVEIEDEDDLRDLMMFVGKETQENLRKEIDGRGNSL